MKVSDFYKDIGIPEFKAIVGKRGSKLFILFLLFFLSLLVIGIANSSKEYLIKKMDDPFIKYIDIEKTSFFTKKGKKELNEDNIKKYILDQDKYKNPSSKNYLGIDTMFTGISRNISFTINGVNKSPQGMLLDKEDDFFKDLIKQRKFITKQPAFSNEGFGIIVTKEFFKNFGLYDSTEWKSISFVDVKEKNISFKLPIAGVVEELRRNYQFAFSRNYLSCIESNQGVFKKDYYTTTTYFIPYLNELPNDLRDEFTILNRPYQINNGCYIDGILIETDPIIGDYDLKNRLDIKLQIEEKIDSISKDLRFYENCLSCNFPINTQMHNKIKEEKENQLKLLQSELQSIENEIELNTSSFQLDTSIYKDAVEVLNITKNNIKFGYSPRSDEEYFSFKLNNLETIEIFRDAIYDVFGIKVEEGKIENKKNLKLFERIIEILYYSLMIFTITSIIFFITNILISHLNSNKRSLGTLKAFGLSNFYIVGLYSFISFFIIGFTFFSAYIFTNIIGQSVLDIFIESMNINNINYINITPYILTACMVFVPLLIILNKVFVYLNDVTPGDLIYERK